MGRIGQVAKTLKNASKSQQEKNGILNAIGYARFSVPLPKKTMPARGSISLMP